MFNTIVRPGVCPGIWKDGPAAGRCDAVASRTSATPFQIPSAAENLGVA